MELIDSHAHLTCPGLVEDVERVLERCASAGVEHIITVAADLCDARAALEMAAAQSMVSATAGIHPHEAGKIAEGDVERVADLLDEAGVVAVGEIGLDYHYDFTDRATQKQVLSAQLEMAAGRGLPLVIHAREALADTVALLERYGFRDKPVVFHCFTGSAAEAAVIGAHGWRLSFTGVVTFKKLAALQAVARDYPAEKLMLETDAPYLSPVPVRHVRPNEPAFLVHTAAFLAELRGVTGEQLAAQTAANTRAFFKLDTGT